MKKSIFKKGRNTCNAIVKDSDLSLFRGKRLTATPQASIRIMGGF
jgi:hypothetical protein